MQKLITLFSMFLFFSSASFADERSNLAVIDSLISEYSTNIFKSLSEQKVDKVILDIIDHPAAEYLKNGILSDPKAKNITFYPEGQLNIALVKIAIKDISVKYDNINADEGIIADENQYLRTINFETSTYTEQAAHPVLPPDNFVVTSIDKVNKETILSLEQNSYGFAKGIVPEDDSSFFDEILEPVVVIGSTAIAIFLFFTIRSG